jgi:mxaD protein
MDTRLWKIPFELKVAKLAPATHIRAHFLTCLELGRRSCIAASIAAAISSSAMAHGATPKKIVEKIDIGAKPEAVWAIIGDFARISTWNPAVASSEAASDPVQGTERILTLKSGGKITDAQTEYNAEKMTYSYRRVDEDVTAFPVGFYSGTITVTPMAEGSQVTWIGRFYRGDMSNEPPPGLEDSDAEEAMTSFFETGLKGLKALAEAN